MNLNKEFFIGMILMVFLATGVIFWLLRKHKAETDTFKDWEEDWKDEKMDVYND